MSQGWWVINSSNAPYALEAWEPYTEPAAAAADAAALYHRLIEGRAKASSCVLRLLAKSLPVLVDVQMAKHPPDSAFCDLLSARRIREQAMSQIGPYVRTILVPEPQVAPKFVPVPEKAPAPVETPEPVLVPARHG